MFFCKINISVDLPLFTCSLDTSIRKTLYETSECIFSLVLVCVCFFFFPSSVCFSAIIRMTISHGCCEGDDTPFGRSSSSHRDFDSESGHSVFNAETPAIVLQEIALKCGTKVS